MFKKYKYSLLLLAAFLILSSAVYAQNMTQMEMKNIGPKYRLHYTLFPADTIAKGELRLKLELPYDEILFVKNNGSYKGKFELSIIIYEVDEFDDRPESKRNVGIGKQVIHENLVKSLSLKEFRMTNSRNKKFLLEKTYILDPLKYRVEILVTDLKTQNRRKIVKNINMDYFKDDKWVQGDLYLVDDIIPGDKEDDIPKAIYIGFTATGRAGTQEFSYTVLSAGKALRKAVFSVDLIEERHEYRFPVKTADLGFNEYKLLLETEIDGKVYKRVIPFRLKYAGMSSLVPDMEIAARQMRYLAMTGYFPYRSYKKIIKASGKEQKDLFQTEWKKLDPTPDTDRNELMDEYYFRARYANQRFAAQLDGWKTDRGMIYMIYGEADAVEDHAMEMGSKPYVIWYYYSVNKQFIFYDYSGLGDYQLSEPISEF